MFCKPQQKYLKVNDMESSYSTKLLSYSEAQFEVYLKDTL